MKRITQTLLALSLVTAGAAFAATPDPSSAPETTSLWSEFPGMRTYASGHLDEAANQGTMHYPSAAAQETPLSAEFPGIPSYADLHRNDAVAQSNVPFPSSANETTSMVEEGLVPGLNRANDAYAGVAGPARN